MTNSNRKGKKGEREAAKAWTQATGRPSRRGQQHKGGNDSPDITDDTFHIEVKRYKELKRKFVIAAMKQSHRECSDKIPIVLCRQDGGPWLAVVMDRDIGRINASFPLPEFRPLIAWMCYANSKAMRAIADVGPLLMNGQVIAIGDYLDGPCTGTNFTVCRLEDLARVCGAMR